MRTPKSQPLACLSYLVGPGPRSARAKAELRAGLANLDQEVHALRLRVSVLPCQPPGPPVVEAEWGGLLPRRSSRDLELVLDWGRAELRIDGAPTPFTASPAEERLCLVRAELLDGRQAPLALLEVGVRSAAAVRAAPGS